MARGGGLVLFGNFTEEVLRLPPAKMTRIAIVHEDEAVRDSITGLVESLGLSARSYDTIASFLAAPEQGECDCLLLDRLLDGEGAAELMECLERGGAAIAIVAMIGDDRARKLDGVRVAGVDTVLSTPFTDSALLGAIRAACDKRFKRGGGQSEAAS